MVVVRFFLPSLPAVRFTLTNLSSPPPTILTFSFLSPSPSPPPTFPSFSSFYLHIHILSFLSHLFLPFYSYLTYSYHSYNPISDFPIGLLPQLDLFHWSSPADSLSNTTGSLTLHSVNEQRPKNFDFLVLMAFCLTLPQIASHETLLFFIARLALCRCSEKKI
jgi:hypothetical protein